MRFANFPGIPLQALTWGLVEGNGLEPQSSTLRIQIGQLADLGIFIQFPAKWPFLFIGKRVRVVAARRCELTSERLDTDVR